jgi:2-dehydropantoate 2-reductase
VTNLTSHRSAKPLRILVVGAGCVGGYFGGRLLEAGQDVTFLVRKQRVSEVARTGLKVSSCFGALTFQKPAILVADKLTEPFDLILLTCKAYDLDDAMASFAGAVGPSTIILPLLNGVLHLETLDARFGCRHVLGEACYISASHGAEGEVVHKNDVHMIVFGARDGARNPQVEAIATAFAGAKFDHRQTDMILQEMWEKWVFVAALAGITCLMRASIGDIAKAGASELAMTMLDECAMIATSQGFSPRAEFLDRTRRIFIAPESPLTASMLHDIEKNAPVEAHHILGDLLHRSDRGGRGKLLLRVAYAHLKAYEARRARGQIPAGRERLTSPISVQLG